MIKSFPKWHLGCLVLCVMSGPGTAAQDKSTLDAESKPNIPEQVDQNFMLLTVDKTKLEAELKAWNTPYQPNNPLKNFKIAIGKEEGDKQKEGDNKTPEGVYLTLRHIPDTKLPKKYGSLAIPLNFPNPMDHLEKKTGYGIWLHGVDDSQRISEAKVTEGCVAFYNPDIARLGDWLQPYQGVVVIAKDSTKVNVESDIKSLSEALSAWQSAWASRDLDVYSSYYHEDFSYKGMKLEQYKDYKKRVFSGYKYMKVLFSDARIATHPKYGVAIFNQDFNGDDRFVSIGRKILYWEKMADGSWKIRRELFEHKSFEKLEYSPSDLLSLQKVGEKVQGTEESPEIKKSASAN